MTSNQGFSYVLHSSATQSVSYTSNSSAGWPYSGQQLAMECDGGDEPRVQLSVNSLTRTVKGNVRVNFRIFCRD